MWTLAVPSVPKVLGEVFNAASPLAGGFLSITAALGDCLVKMADAVNNSTVFKTVLDGIHWIIGKVSEGMQAFAGVLTNVSNNVSVVFDPLKTKEMFEDNLTEVTIEGGDTIEKHENMELVQISKMGEEWWFILRDIPAEELEQMALKAQLDYLSMMVDPEL